MVDKSIVTKQLNLDNMSNLIVLEYRQNTCYTTVIPLEKAVEKYKEQKLSVNKENSTWNFKNRERKIGQSRSCERGSRWGIIGVYDSSNIDQLNSMVSHSQEATSSSHGMGDDL